MVAGGLLTAFCNNYAGLFVGRLTSGTGAVLLNVLLTKMTTDWFANREIGTALGLLVSSWPIGIGIALVTMPWLAVHASVATAFASTAVVAALVLFLIAAIYRVPPEGAVSLRSSRVESPRLSRGELGLVSLAGGVWMLFNVGYILVVSFGPALLMSQGLSQRDAGFMTSLVSWTVIITIPLGGVLIDRVGHATTLMIASFAGGLGLSAMLMPAAPSLALMTFIGALGGTAGRCPDGATGRIVAPAKSRGRNGDLFYVVLCRPGGFDSDRGHSPRRKRSRFVHALRTL